MEQQNPAEGDNRTILREFVLLHHVRRILLVCGSSLSGLRVNQDLQWLSGNCDVELVPFRDFEPNPAYESVVAGVELFRQRGCDAILAAGGGSAMDVAKCIKLYADLPTDCLLLEQKVTPNQIPFLAIPTTAGTGSEATRFAVIYYKGEKQSIAHDSILPDTVILDGSVLESLPDYQKKATMLDVLSHAVESIWCVNATEKSRGYAAEAIGLVLDHVDAYLRGDPSVNQAMLYGAFLAGKAINLTKTTAGHAMCYKLTTHYGISHGHAAALCNMGLWPHILEHVELGRDRAHLQAGLDCLAKSFRCNTAREAYGKFCSLIPELNLRIPELKSDEELEFLVHSVNTERLQNHPIVLTEDTIREIYLSILQDKR